MLNARTSTKPAQRFQWFATVDQSLAAMLEAIRHTQSSIRFEMYIYTESRIGEKFLNALVDAAQRGVQVRVLIDAWGSMTLPDRFWAPAVDAGVQFRWFNRIGVRYCGFRNHRKLLVCDDQVAFIGGFNIAAEYEGDGIHSGWFDLGLQISAQLVQPLADSFDLMFDLADFRHRRFTFLRKTPLHQRLEATAGQVIVGGPGRGKNLFKQALLSDLKNAHSARIICAYFLPTLPIRRALIRLAKRGQPVQLILPAKSDVPMSRLAVHRFYTAFLKAGVRIYEFQPQILHAKLVIINDTVYAGSANLDRRSFYINYELMVRLQDQQLAHEAVSIFNNTLEHSREITLPEWKSSRTLWTRITAYSAYWVLARLDPFIARTQLGLLSRQRQPRSARGCM